MSDESDQTDDDYARTSGRKKLVLRIVCAIIVLPMIVGIIAGLIHIAADIWRELSRH